MSVAGLGNEVISIYAFDGTTVWLDREQRVGLFEVGNFLGNGAAGTVYECEHTLTHNHYAMKILNPIGYKILSPALLRRCSILSRGKTVSDGNLPTHLLNSVLITKENIWWLLNGAAGNRQYLACYYSEKLNGLKELSLNQCIQVWGTEPMGVNLDSEDITDAFSSNALPTIPPKYLDFLRKRSRIFREIRNMRKISNHRNVIKLVTASLSEINEQMLIIL
jgi:serine/threonine protein kinase